MSQLKGSPDVSDYQKLRRILFAWMKNGGKGVPVKCGTLLRVLRTPSVDLDSLAAELEEVAIALDQGGIFLLDTSTYSWCAHVYFNYRAYSGHADNEYVHHYMYMPIQVDVCSAICAHANS